MTTARRPTAPKYLRDGGRVLWRGIVRDHALDPAQLVQLEEACRAKDRLDQLDLVLRGDVDTWATIEERESRPAYLKVDAALSKANDTANLLKQLLAALRLPDTATGQRPQRRGARGAQKPSVPGGAAAGTVSSLDRARERAARSS